MSDVPARILPSYSSCSCTLKVSHIKDAKFSPLTWRTASSTNSLSVSFGLACLCSISLFPYLSLSLSVSLPVSPVSVSTLFPQERDMRGRVQTRTSSSRSSAFMSHSHDYSHDLAIILLSFFCRLWTMTPSNLTETSLCVAGSWGLKNGTW